MSSQTAFPDAPLASSPVLAGEHVAFTGTLASMTHAVAMDLVQRHGFIETGRAAKTWLIGGEWYDSIYWRREL